MALPSIQFPFKPHGRSDADLQDLEFDKAFNSFFQPGSLNILAMENAGEYTDRDRDALFDASLKDPSNILLQQVRATGVPAEMETFAIYEMHQLVFTLGDKDAICAREWLLLDEWNRSNPTRPVIPYMESFPTEEIASLIETQGDALDFDSADIVESDSWPQVQRRFREIARRAIELTAIRDQNWIRQLGQLIRNATRKTPLRIMVGLDARSRSGDGTSKLGWRDRGAFGYCLATGKRPKGDNIGSPRQLARQSSL